MRHRRWAARITCCAASLTLSASANTNLPAASQNCDRSLFDLTPTSSVAALWKGDTQPFVAIRTNPQSGYKSVYYSADVLQLDSATLPSLRGTTVAPLAKVDEIVFDARSVILDAPLVLESARVTIYGQHVTFGKHGSIALVDSPRRGGDAITIVAQDLDLSQAPWRPFQFLTSDPSITDPRRLTIVAPSVKLRAGAPATKESIRSLTLDDAYAEQLDGLDPYRNYDISLGELAIPKYRQSLSVDMAWPRQTAAKVERLFTLDPFSPESSQFIQAQITEIKNGLIGTEQSFALASLDKIASYIANGEDILGFSKYYVPRRTFTSLLAEFQSNYDRDLSVLQSWDETIVSAARDSDPRVRDTALQALENKLSGDLGTEGALQDRIGSGLTEMANIEQAVSGKEPLVTEGVARARRSYEEDKAKGETAANIRGVATIAAVAVAFLPVATPVAVAAMTAINTAGTVVANHQTAQAPDLRTVVLTVEESLATSKAFRAQAEEATKHWNDFRKAHDDYNTATDEKLKRDARDQRAQAMSDFGGSVVGLFKGLSLPTPPQLKMSDYEAKDSELQRLLREVGEARVRETALLEQLAIDQRALRDVVAGRAEASQARQELLKLKPSNDFERARLQQLGWLIRYGVLSDLASNVAVLLRSYRYHTLSVLQSPIDQGYFWSIYSIQRPITTADKGKGNAADRFLGEVTADDLQAELDSQRTRLKNGLAALHRDADSGYKQYKLGLVAWQETATEFAFDCSKMDQRCRFLQSVNADIARQVGDIARGGKGIVSQPMLLPVSVTPIGMARPNRLVDVSVSASFRNGSALAKKSIVFSVIHPIHGQLSALNSCFGVDFRHRSAPMNEQQFSTTCSLDRNGKPNCQRLAGLTRTDYADENNQLVFMPYQAAYALRVDVQDARDGNPPVLEGLQVKFRILN